MKKIQTHALTGLALDWAVGIAEKQELLIYRFVDGQRHVRARKHYHGYGWVDRDIYWSPSRDWATGGPIMDREKISVMDANGCWAGRKTYWDNSKESLSLYGPTPLIAAMRAFVALKLGDEVDIPNELLPAADSLPK